MAADGGKGAFLENLQQLDLHWYRHLADLIEKQRPVRAAALEDALVVIDRPGEGAFAVAEQLRFDQHFGELRQVDGDEALSEVDGKPALHGNVGNELRASDRRRRRSLASARFTKKERREILHSIPQCRLVAAHIVGEHVIPERLAQPPHRFAFSGQ